MAVYGAAHLVTDCLGQWPIWWEKIFDMLEGPNTRVRIGDQSSNVANTHFQYIFIIFALQIHQ